MSHRRKAGRNNAARKVAAQKIRRAQRDAARHGTTLIDVRTNASGRSAFYHADGSRTVELTPDDAAQLREYREWAAAEYRRRWGRPMGPDDLLFPDWDAPEPNTPVNTASMEARMVAAMEAAGWDPAFIYAYQVTGRLVTEENYDLLTDEDQQEWEDAIDRYRRLHG